MMSEEKYDQQIEFKLQKMQTLHITNNQSRMDAVVRHYVNPILKPLLSFLAIKTTLQPCMHQFNPMQ
jgi:hypothetical protein